MRPFSVRHPVHNTIHHFRRTTLELLGFVKTGD